MAIKFLLCNFLTHFKYLHISYTLQVLTFLTHSYTLQVLSRETATCLLMATVENNADREWEDPLEKGMAAHSSILAWRIPWTEKSGGLPSMWSQRVRHDWVTHTHTHTKHFHQLRKFYWTMFLYREGPVFVEVVLVLFSQSITDSFLSVFYTEISLQATVVWQEWYVLFSLKQLEHWKNTWNIFWDIRHWKRGRTEADLWKKQNEETWVLWLTQLRPSDSF